MEDILANNILIPHTVFWTAVITIAIGLLGSYIFTQVNFVKIEKNLEITKVKIDGEMELLKVQVEKDNEYIKGVTEENKKMYVTIQADLGEIKNAMNLKQDKKFIT